MAPTKTPEGRQTTYPDWRLSSGAHGPAEKTLTQVKLFKNVLALTILDVTAGHCSLLHRLARFYILKLGEPFLGASLPRMRISCVTFCVLSLPRLVAWNSLFRLCFTICLHRPLGLPGLPVDLLEKQESRPNSCSDCQPHAVQVIDLVRICLVRIHTKGWQ